ncbi:MAG: NAD(+) synthase, partial [Bacteroidales bacterium]|nr:NAD(+) synthase [Bacteroidales bacterium]
AYSNKFGHIVLNTSNKSEVAVGFGTLHGDMCGSLAVLADIYKTEVYALAEYINRDKIIIPQNIIDKVPSAELAPNQKDSDRLPDYNILDAILKEYIENSKTAEEIINLGFDADIVKRSIKMVNMNEFKRYQSAPIIKVSPKSLAMKPRIPLIIK